MNGTWDFERQKITAKTTINVYLFVLNQFGLIIYSKIYV